MWRALHRTIKNTTLNDAFTIEYRSDDDLSLSSQTIARPLRSIRSVESVECSTNQQNEGVEGTNSSGSSTVHSSEGSDPPPWMLAPKGPGTLDLGDLEEIEQRSHTCKFCELIADSAHITLKSSERHPLLFRRKGSAYRVKCYLERLLYSLYISEGVRSSHGILHIKRLYLRLSPFIYRCVNQLNCSHASSQFHQSRTIGCNL
jgi:hypothetical protein